MFESELKSYILKIATLETSIKSAESDKKIVEIEFESFKEKKNAELKVSFV